MQVRSLKLPKALDTRLTKRAHGAGLSKSAVLREALAAHLRAGPRPERLSFLEGAADLVGCVDGPPDLSTNRAYLDDLGSAAK